MKINKIIFLSVAVLMFIIQSCTMDDNNTGTQNPPKPTPTPTSPYSIQIKFADWDKDENQIGGLITIVKAKDEVSIKNYVLYWGKNDNTRNGDPIISLPPAGKDIEYTLPDDTIPPIGTTKMLVFVETTKSELFFSGSIFVSDIICQRVSDINPGSGNTFYGSEDTYIFQDKLFFSGNDNIHGNELFAYDGINSPEMIADINKPANNGSYPNHYYEFNGKLYFTCNDSAIYVYDGINQPSPAFSDSSLQSSYGHRIFQAFHNKLYFLGDKYETGEELWVYDGINPPTLVYDIREGTENSSPDYLTVCNNKLYFKAWDDVGTNSNIWVYADDGSNPVCLIDNPVYSKIYSIFSHNNKLYFVAYDSTNGSQLWSYDEVNKAVRLTKIGNMYIDGINAYMCPVFYNNKLYFSATILGTESLWCSDLSGNVEQLTFQRLGPWNIQYIYALNGKIYFMDGNGSDYMKELFSYDLTTNQINMYKLNLDLNTPSDPMLLNIFKDKLYIAVKCDDYGNELWSFTEKDF